MSRKDVHPYHSIGDAIVLGKYGPPSSEGQSLRQAMMTGNQDRLKIGLLAALLREMKELRRQLPEAIGRKFRNVILSEISLRIGKKQPPRKTNTKPPAKGKKIVGPRR